MNSTKPSTEQDVIRTGFLKKAKRMKKKFFVLRGESGEHPARLEYYDSDRKWRNGNPPKRCVVLKTCFNINKKYDSKNRNVLALYTKNETFALCTETEADLNSWLKDLLLHQRGEDVVDGDEPKPNFEHVWEVTVTKKCLGSQKNILGPYRLCLTSKTLKLVKVSTEEESETYEFILNQIRRCGNAGTYFFMEVGRSAVTGSGELWMMCEDGLIAQNIHEAILGAMNSIKEDHPVLRRPRTQSSSATEMQKPAVGISRRQTNPVSMTQVGRDRTDSNNLRKRTSSDNQTEVPSSGVGNGRSSSYQHPCDIPKSTLNVAASPPARNPSPVPPLILEYPGFKSSDDYEVTSCLTDLTNLNQPFMQDASVQKSLDENYVEHLSESDKANRNGRSDYFEMTPQTQILSSSPGPRSVRGTFGSSSVGRTPSQSSSTSIGSKVMHISEWRRARSSNAGSVTSERTISESSSVNQEYLDMNSPVSASWVPGDILGTFSSMGDSQISKSSGSHTRSSSLCDGDDTVDGGTTSDYLTMAPQGDSLSKLPYMDMKGKGSYPGSLTRSTRDNGILSSPMSACSLASSFTSGTASAHAGTPPSLPSFRETYALDKVTSYVSANTDDDACMRKTRAYSVGSKLEVKSRKKRLEVLEVPQELPRVRSFSMGNNISGTAKPVKPFPLPSQPIVLTKPGKKSLSAPMLGTSPLSSSWSGNTGTFFKHLFGSMTSSGRSSDILELDVAEPHASSVDSLSSSYLEDRTRKESFSSHEGGSRASSTSGVVLSRNRSDSRTSSLLGRASGKLASMKKDRKRERLESVPQGRDQDYIEVDCQSPVTEDYMTMDGSMTGSIDSRSSRKTSESERVPRSRKVSQTIPDIQVDTSGSDYLPMEYRKETIEEKNEYIEMQPRIRVTEPEDSVILRKKCNNDYLLMGSPSSGTVTPSNISCRNSRTEDEFDDYMEMSFKETGTLKVRPERAKSLIGDDSGPQRKSSKTQNTLASISNILSRRSSKKDPKKMPSPSPSSTLPRPAKSAPPSQYPSLKRTMSKGSKDDNLCDYLPMSMPKTSPTQLPSPVSPEPDYVDLAMSPPQTRPNSSLPISIQPLKPRGSPLGLSPKEGIKVEVQKVKGSDYTGFVSLAKVNSPDAPSSSSDLFVFETCKEERPKKDYVNMDFTKTRKLSEPGQLLSMISPLAMSPIPEKSQSSSVETLTSPADFNEARRDSRISSVTDLLEKAATSMQLTPKRHCSGDPPVRKNSAIFRSNSYHPMNKCRSASVLPSLSDIPDGKALNAFEVNCKPAKSPPFSIVSGFFQSKNAAHTSRSSSSSVTSLGEEEEIKSMIWTGANSVALSPHLKESSSTTPSSQSRPSSTSSEKELNYATLDLPPPKDGQRSRPCSTGPEPVLPVLSYAQIDFTRHEGLKQIASSQKPREKEMS